MKKPTRQGFVCVSEADVGYGTRNEKRAQLRREKEEPLQLDLPSAVCHILPVGTFHPAAVVPAVPRVWFPHRVGGVFSV